MVDNKFTKTEEQYNTCAAHLSNTAIFMIYFFVYDIYVVTYYIFLIIIRIRDIVSAENISSCSALHVQLYNSNY